jgi:uncharacterized membrane protein
MEFKQLDPVAWEKIAWMMAVMAAIVGVGVVILLRFRGASEKKENEVSQSLTKFREMHSRGDLSDQEFRTIKAKLAAKVRQALKESEEPG